MWKTRGRNTISPSKEREASISLVIKDVFSFSYNYRGKAWAFSEQQLKAIAKNSNSPFPQSHDYPSQCPNLVFTIYQKT